MCALLAAGAAHAEKADRDKPTNVEADRMRYDDLKQVNVFSGNVVLTKGTIIIKGDTVTVRQDPEGYQYATATVNGPASGAANAKTDKLASFRQKRDGLDQYYEGYAEKIDYDGKTDKVYLRQRALIQRLEGATVGDEARGNLIIYDQRTETYNIEGGKESGNSNNPNGGRVRVILQPSSRPATSGNTVPLQPSPALNSPRPE
jgi:lipopolysaccharide export system protein LptA